MEPLPRCLGGLRRAGLIETWHVPARSRRAALAGHLEQTTVATPMEHVGSPEYIAFMAAAHAIDPSLFVTG